MWNMYDEHGKFVQQVSSAWVVSKLVRYERVKQADAEAGVSRLEKQEGKVWLGAGDFSYRNF